MKAVIIYASKHNENTYKLVKAISEKFSVEIINAEENDKIDLTKYDLIGFASGIAYGKFYKSIISSEEEFLPEGKKVFFIYTCGRNSKDFSEPLKNIAKNKNCTVLGTYGCKGYNKYGPFKLIGGINKNRPNDEDIQGAVNFFEGLL